ncbi:hypothetical protein MASR2M39_12450 [Ignavibacteriales bacterium]
MIVVWWAIWAKLHLQDLAKETKVYPHLNNMGKLISIGRVIEMTLIHSRTGSRDPLFIPDENNRVFSGIDTLFTDSLLDPTGSYSYKLTAKDNQGNVNKLDSVTVVLTGISAGEESQTPERIYLYQNYLIPLKSFNKDKILTYRRIEVILRVYDVNGGLVAMLQNGWLPAGEYEREFSPTTIGTIKDIASGVYFYNLLVRDKNLIPFFVKTEKMVFLK